MITIYGWGEEREERKKLTVKNRSRKNRRSKNEEK